MRLLPFLQDLTQTVKESVIESLNDARWKTVVRKKDTDLTWRVDQLAEQRAIEFIKSRGLAVRLVSEEAGTIDIGRKPEFIVILDPLDGSLNFTRSIPFCSVSAAAGRYKSHFKLRDLEVGVVKSVFTEDSFYAEKGDGSYKNGRQLSIEDQRFPKSSKTKPLLSLYIHGVEKTRYGYERLIVNSKVRTLGSVALELCYLADSNLDAVLDLRGNLRVVDVAAGKIVLEEAGGIIKIIGDVNPFDVNKGFCMVAAKNEVLLDKLLEMIGFEKGF